MFAAFEPDPIRRPALAFDVTPAGAADLDGLVELALERDGGEARQHRERMLKRLELGPRAGRLLVAKSSAGKLLGYGASELLSWASETADTRRAPGGWYLTGVIVAPAARRRGVGRALTEARIEAWPSHTGPLRFVVNAQNRASIELHSGLGFELEAESVQVPGVRFAGGRGLLFRLERA